MSSGKAELARAGTMQVTAKEGTAYLSKNLTDWKKPYLMTDGDGDEDAEDQPEESTEDSVEEEEDEPEPPVKKARFSKATTMVNTSKEAKALLGAEKLADTRQETKLQKSKNTKAKKAAMKRATTMAKAKEDAEAVYGEDLDLSEGRTLRKRKSTDKEDKADKPKEKKAAMKKAGTMQATAKEGKDFLKRSKKPGGKGKKAKGKGKK